MKRGMFLVRFKATDVRDHVLSGHYFFDRKPLIIKQWNSEMDFEKDDLKTVLVWVQLKLNLKYWGERFA